MAIVANTPPYSANNDFAGNVLSIVKGWAILLMVIGHSGCPEALSKWIYLFHMPVFFIASGWFYKEIYFDEGWLYIRKRILRLYLPFVIYSILFLVLHNMLLNVGWMNEQYGTETGTAYCYSMAEIEYRLKLIVLDMDGYDEYVLGTFWFMKVLFVGSILWGCLNYILKRIIQKNGYAAILTLSILFVALMALTLLNMRIPFFHRWVGVRELLGALFVGMGYMLRQYGSKLLNYWGCAVGLLILIVMTWFRPISFLGCNSVLDDVEMIITGCGGFLMLYGVSKWMQNNGKILGTMGKVSFYVMTFHFLCMKPISWILIQIYDLDPLMIGCHPVIPNMGGCWWIMYAIFAVSVSALIGWGISAGKKMIKDKILL